MESEKRYGLLKPWFFIALLIFSHISIFSNAYAIGNKKSILPDIHGNYILNSSLQRTGGSGQETLLRSGEYVTNDITLNVHQTLEKSKNLATDLHLRKTNDPHTDDRKDLHLLGLTAKASDPSTTVTFGDFFGDFSQYSLSRSIEGFDLRWHPGNFSMDGVATRLHRADEGVRYERFLAGGRTKWEFFKEGKRIKNLAVGTNFTAVEDAHDSIEKSDGVKDASNRVGSVDVKAVLWEKYRFEGEVARSWEDKDTASSSGGLRNTGTALRLKMDGRVSKKLKGNVGYEWVGAHFRTLAGSAIPDRAMVRSRADYQWNRRWKTDGRINMSIDRMDDSPQNKRTLALTPGTGLQWTPDDKIGPLEDLFVRLYWDLRRRTSGDADNGQIDFMSHEMGIEDDLHVGPWRMDHGFGVRKLADDLTKTNSLMGYDGRFGVGTRRKIFGLESSPSARYEFLYEDLYKEQERDFIQTVSVGMDTELTKDMRLDQRYSVQSAFRPADDANSVQFRLHTALESQFFGHKDKRWRVQYDGTFFSHSSSIQRFQEHKLQGEFLWKF